MTEALRLVDTDEDVAALMLRWGGRRAPRPAGWRWPRTRRRTRRSRPRRPGPGARPPEILARNAEDVAEARSRGQSAALVDRLVLDAPRLEGVAGAIEAVAGLPDPVGRRPCRLRAGRTAS
jgi:glutamate-5-semialdehyde dehydrogenase